MLLIPFPLPVMPVVAVPAAAAGGAAGVGGAGLAAVADDLLVDVLDHLPDLQEVVGHEALPLERLVAEVLVGQHVERDLDKLWQLLFDDDVEHPCGDGLVEEDALRLAASVPGQQPVERPAADLGEYDWGVAGHAEVLVAAGLADSVGHRSPSMSDSSS